MGPRLRANVREFVEGMRKAKRQVEEGETDGE